MSNVTVRKSNGDTLEVTLLTLFRWLADEHSYPDVLSCLIKAGSITVALQDGTAHVRYADAERRHREISLPLGDFTADARLTFELPVSIRCRASSPPAARQIIEETIKGSRQVPEHFALEINGDEVEAFFHGLEIGSFVGVRGVAISDVRRTTARLLLSQETPS
jgi:hypothetical protein